MKGGGSVKGLNRGLLVVAYFACNSHGHGDVDVTSARATEVPGTEFVLAVS